MNGKKTVYEEYEIQTIYYVIREKPAEYPEHFVVSEWLIQDADPKLQGNLVLCKTLEEAREKIPNGFFRMKRHPGDERSIVETWL